MNTNIGVITGNLAKDPDLKFIPSSGMAIARITVAVNGMKDDDVSFVDVDVFGKTAEAVANFTKKGSKVAVTYYLKQERWKNKEGETRTKLSCKATRVEFLSTANNNQQNNTSNESFDEGDVFEPTDDDDIPF